MNPNGTLSSAVKISGESLAGEMNRLKSDLDAVRERAYIRLSEIKSQREALDVEERTLLEIVGKKPQRKRRAKSATTKDSTP
jgi:hypothetical protein